MQASIRGTSMVKLTNQGMKRLDIAIKRGLCLYCLKKIDPGEKTIRRCHVNCYKQLNIKIKKGEIRERDAVKDAFLGESCPSGRKPVPPAQIHEAEQ